MEQIDFNQIDEMFNQVNQNLKDVDKNIKKAKEYLALEQFIFMLIIKVYIRNDIYLLFFIL